MIHQHNGVAIHLYDLKAVRMEYEGVGGYLIFEFNNAIISVEELESGNFVDRSYRNEPVSQFYDDLIDLRDNFKTWVEVWSEFVIS